QMRIWRGYKREGGWRKKRRAGACQTGLVSRGYIRGSMKCEDVRQGDAAAERQRKKKMMVGPQRQQPSHRHSSTITTIVSLRCPDSTSRFHVHSQRGSWHAHASQRQKRKNLEVLLPPSFILFHFLS